MDRQVSSHPRNAQQSNTTIMWRPSSSPFHTISHSHTLFVYISSQKLWISTENKSHASNGAASQVTGKWPHPTAEDWSRLAIAVSACQKKAFTLLTLHCHQKNAEIHPGVPKLASDPRSRKYPWNVTRKMCPLNVCLSQPSLERRLPNASNRAPTCALQKRPI